MSFIVNFKKTPDFFWKNIFKIVNSIKFLIYDTIQRLKGLTNEPYLNVLFLFFIDK